MILHSRAVDEMHQHSGRRFPRDAVVVIGIITSKSMSSSPLMLSDCHSADDSLPDDMVCII